MKTATRRDWAVVRMPKKRAQLAVDRTFSPEEMELIKRGFIPQEMAQKWFIYFERDSLYVHRSWTGVCIYIVEFEKKSNAYLISRVTANRNAEQWPETDDAYDAKLLLYLIDGALLARPVEFPTRTGESSDEEEEDVEAEESSEPPLTSEPKPAGEPLLNSDLLTEEERAAEPGFGLLTAASRLGLIYLASIPEMEKLLRDHTKEALTLYKLCLQGAPPKSRLHDEIEKVTRRLAKVLRGEDPRYMAIPWFTDPNQLRQVLYDQHLSAFGDDPKLPGWKADPVREQVSFFLEFAVEIADESKSPEDFAEQINDHIRRHVALFMGIPESHYQYPSQKPGAKAKNRGKATTPNA